MRLDFRSSNYFSRGEVCLNHVTWKYSRDEIDSLFLKGEKISAFKNETGNVIIKFCKGYNS